MPGRVCVSYGLFRRYTPPRRRSATRCLRTFWNALSSPTPSYGASVRTLLTHSPVNLLLGCIPLSLVVFYSSQLHHQDVVIFVFCALSIIPLASLLGLATEQVSLKTNDAVGGLVNASMGNVVELIVAAIGLRDVGDGY